MRVFNMAYVSTCKSDRMPFTFRPGLHRVYRILGIQVLECCVVAHFFLLLAEITDIYIYIYEARNFKYQN